MKKGFITTYLKLSLSLMIVLSFNSCSDDKDDICLPGVAELNSAQIGTYRGLLTLNATDVINPSGTATISETDCKTYMVTFSDNVPSIDGIQFVASDENTVFTFINSISTLTVIVNTDEESLSVVKSDSPIITFDGEI